MDQTCETAAVAILYNGWLLDQNRITQQAFSDTMDDYDRRWPGAAEREKVFAAAHYVGRHAKTQDLVSRSGAAAVLLWWLFRSGKYKGTNKDWHAERDLIVTFHEHGENKPIKVDLWTSQRSLTEMAADKANSQEIRPINSAAYNIYRNGPQLNEEITWFALGDDAVFWFAIASIMTMAAPS